MPSIHSLPTRSRFLRATVCSTSSALCLHHACKRSYPFVEDSGFVSHVEKQRVWSRSCGLQGFLRTIQWLCPRFGLQDIVGALSCDTWLLQTNEQLSRLSFYQQCLGSGTASLSAADVRKMWCDCRKEICSTWLFQESIPAFPLGNANHPLPTRSSRLLRAAVRFTS